LAQAITLAMAQINPQFAEIGQQFVVHYYQTFDTNRQALLPLYMDQSLLTFEGEQFQGAQSIVQKLCTLQFTKVQHEIVKADHQPNPTNGGVITFVTGNLKVDDSPNPLKFAEVFHLAQTGSGWQIINNMFRLNIG
jgi:hypothetical protein